MKSQLLWKFLGISLLLIGLVILQLWLSIDYLASNYFMVGQLATAFNRMADSLQRVEDMRRTMVINVAHELRTPLTNMRGYLEGLSDGVVTPSKQTFDLLHQETLRLVKLVEDHLQLVKADEARATLRLERVNLEELALQALALFGPKFTDKAITADADLSNALAKILADPEKLAQVFRNLLQNAWQYTPRGEWVRISAEHLPGAIKLIFCNSGDGIAAADLPHIFERFYRTEKSRSREHGGAGIGLAIVKELIEAHSGSVGAESSGGKTWIWFTLPT